MPHQHAVPLETMVLPRQDMELSSIKTVTQRLRDSVGVYPDKTAIVCGAQQLSYQELHDRTMALASLLVEAGLRKGDRVGCLLRKTPETIVCFLGAMAAGGVFFPLDPNMPQQARQASLAATRPGALFVAREFLPLLRDMHGLPEPERIFVVPDTTGAAAASPCRSYLEHEGRLSRPVRLPELGPQDPAYLNFTSGTTGLPKCALTTHANIDANTSAAVQALGLGPDDVHLCMFPAFVHPHEIFARPISLGGSLVLLDTVQPKSIAKALHEHKVTTLMAVASIYETLVRLNTLKGLDFSSLRVPESGGMHVTPTLRNAFAERFGLPILAVWGSTETAGIALANRMVQGDPRCLEAPPGSMGRPCPGYEARVVTQSCRDAGLDEVGELWLRGPGICQSYHQGPEVREPVVDHEGWFHTGDLVRRSDKGFFFFESRATGMMKVGGVKVYPVEIENVLRSHPDIAEVAVVKSDDLLHGEIPRAFVVLREGAVLDKAGIRHFCDGRLHRLKVPKLVEFVDELPRTPGGKVAWKKLSSVC